MKETYQLTGQEIHGLLIDAAEKGAESAENEESPIEWTSAIEKYADKIIRSLEGE